MNSTNWVTLAATVLAVTTVSALASAPASPQGQPGITVPPDHARVPTSPQLHSTLTKISVKVEDGVATTELSETIANRGPRDAEADWLLPLPAGATADGFKMIVGGKEQSAELLDAGKARGIYEEIVRRRRDPGLLEYVDCGLIRARVFPIPANGSVEVRVRWRHVLPQSGNLSTYSFPLRAAGLGGRSVDKLSLDLAIHSRVPLRSVWSPLGGVEIRKANDHEARVGLEIGGGQLAARDLEVFYGTSTDDFGISLLPFRVAGKAGHFLALVTPKQDGADDPNTVRVVQFVLDTSGSMQGTKMDQARRALRFFVDSLKPGDRFNVIPFSTEARPFFDTAVAADPEHLAMARDKIAALEARGGTNIDEAIATALRCSAGNQLPGLADKQIVPIVVFLTDGLPTVGETNPETMLARHLRGSGSRPRFFVFGVGNDVNTRLLDAMAEATRGDRDYVREHEDIEVKTGALFTKLSHPVLTDVRLVVEGITIEGQEPKELPDLFRGSRLMVLGRYTGDGHVAIRLKGKVGGVEKEFVYEASFPKESAQHDFVATLWAQRRIGGLLDAIRLNGASPELVDEVTRLGKEYGIATPYTSHLIVEEGMQLAQRRGIERDAGRQVGFVAGDEQALRRVRDELRRAGQVEESADAEVVLVEAERLGEEARGSRERFERLPTAPVSGGEAVTRSLELKQLKDAGIPAEDSSAGPASPGPGGAARGGRAGGAGGSGSLVVQQIGSTQLQLVGGVWVDRAYTEAMRGKERKIVAFSDEYFALLARHPGLRKVLAFSTRAVIVVEGAAIEIVDAD